MTTVELTESPVNTGADFLRMIEEVQRGENVNENLAVLCEQFRGVVIAAAQKSGFRQETCDIINDAPFFIYKAALSYDPNRGAAFAGYLTRKVGWFIGHQWQKRHERVMQDKGKIKWVPRHFLPIEDRDFIDERSASEGREQIGFDASHFDDAAFQRALCKLDREDRDTIDAFLVTGNKYDTAAKFGVTPQTLYKRFNKIIPTIKTFYRLELGVFSDRTNPSEFPIDDNIPLPAA